MQVPESPVSQAERGASDRNPSLLIAKFNLQVYHQPEVQLAEAVLHCILALADHNENTHFALDEQ